MLSQEQQAQSTLGSWFLVPFPNEEYQGSFEKWLILELGQDVYRMSLVHLVPEGKAVLKENLKDEYMSKRHKSQMKEIPMARARNNLSNKVSTVEPHQMIKN